MGQDKKNEITSLHVCRPTRYIDLAIDITLLWYALSRPKLASKASSHKPRIIKLIARYNQFPVFCIISYAACISRACAKKEKAHKASRIMSQTIASSRLVTELRIFIVFRLCHRKPCCTLEFKNVSHKDVGPSFTWAYLRDFSGLTPKMNHFLVERPKMQRKCGQFGHQWNSQIQTPPPQFVSVFAHVVFYMGCAEYHSSCVPVIFKPWPLIWNRSMKTESVQKNYPVIRLHLCTYSACASV